MSCFLGVLNENSLSEFVETMLMFCNDKVEDIVIADVKIVSQHLNTFSEKVFEEATEASDIGAKPKKRNELNFLKVPSAATSSLDLNVVITGEYLPPPTLDLGLEVTDTLKTEGQESEFLDTIKKIPEFKSITEIQHEVIEPDSMILDLVDEEENSSNRSLFYSVFGGIVFIALLLATAFGYMYFKNDNKSGGRGLLPQGSLNYNVDKFARRGSEASRGGRRSSRASFKNAFQLERSFSAMWNS